MNTVTATERPHYLPFGTGRVLIVQVWNGAVAKLAGGGAGGRLREAMICQENGEPFTTPFLLKNLFNSPAELVTFLRDSADPLALREKLSKMFFNDSPENFKFHFRSVAIGDCHSIFVIVGDETGMVRARRLIASFGTAQT